MRGLKPLKCPMPSQWQNRLRRITFFDLLACLGAAARAKNSKTSVGGLPPPSRPLYFISTATTSVITFIIIFIIIINISSSLLLLQYGYMCVCMETCLSQVPGSDWPTSGWWDAPRATGQACLLSGLIVALGCDVEVGSRRFNGFVVTLLWCCCRYQSGASETSNVVPTLCVCMNVCIYLFIYSYIYVYIYI